LKHMLYICKKIIIMKKEFELTLEKIHEKLEIKTDFKLWIRTILVACNFRRGIDFIEKKNEMYFTKRAANKMFINNNALAMRARGCNEDEIRNYMNEQKAIVRASQKMPVIIDKYFEHGVTPYICTDVCKIIKWNKDPRSIARQLRRVFGTPTHTTINGVQGKYYFLELKNKSV